MKRLYIFLIFALTALVSQGQIVPVNLELLGQLRDDWRRGVPRAKTMVAALEKKADKYIFATAPSVVNKGKLPPSNDPRDFISISRYWWPDSTKADGLPYIRRDGYVNPEVNTVYQSHNKSNMMAYAVDCLTILYYLTSKEVYAEHAARYLRRWFLDPKEGMNPNLVYAQIIPGRHVLRGTGTLQGRAIFRAVCMSQLIEKSKTWTVGDKKELTDWASAMLYWLEKSTQGRKEHAAGNNHGVWYDVSHLLLLSYLDRKEDVQRIVKEELMCRLDSQMAEDGSLPQELERTLSMHYETFLMEALLQVSYIAKGVGVDFWNLSTSSGKPLKRMVEYMFPYYQKPQTWKYKQISPFKIQRTVPLLYEVGMTTGNQEYVKFAEKTGLDTPSGLLAPYYFLFK